jgi:uncharacterized protein involved in exopolysaccharide biosynthesis
MIRRRWRLGAGVSMAVVAAAALVLVFSRPVYRAEARLRIEDNPPSPGVSPNISALSLFRAGGDPFENDLEVLTSRTLAENVVRSAALSVSLHAPRGWHRDSIFTSLAVEDSTVEATWTVAWRGEGLEIRMSSPRDSAVATVAPGQPVRFGGVRAVFRERRPSGPASVKLVTEPFDEAVRTLSREIGVERTRREANVLDLTYTHHDPGVADRVVSATLRHFVLMRSELFQRESGETVDSLRAVVTKTADELRAAESELEVMQRTSGLVAPEAQSEALVERYETALLALEEARAEQALLEGQMDRVRSEEDPIAAWTALVAAPAFLDNQTVGDLLTRLTELVEARAQLTSVRTLDSREVRTLDERIARLDGALRSLAAEYRTGLDQRESELTVRLGALEDRLGQVPGQVVELGRRQRAVRLLSELLVLTEQRLRQEELREALSFATVQVIDPPFVRFRPVWPRKRLGAAVGLLVGLGAAALAMVFTEAADTRIRTAADLETVTSVPVLGAPVLSDVSMGRGDLLAAVPGGSILVGCRGSDDLASRTLRVLGLPEDSAAGPVDDPSDAAAVAARGRPVIVVAAVGRSGRDDLGRSVHWLERAGAEVVGVLGAVETMKDQQALWG